MDSDAEMMARHGRILAGLSERAYELACVLQEKAVAAETPAEQAAFARAFHEVSRSVRQSLALELRLRRETRRLEREEAAEAEAARTERAGRVEARKTEIRNAVRPLIWREYEDDDARILDEALEDLLDEVGGTEAFAADPVRAVLARMKADLGIAAASVDGSTDGSDGADGTAPAAGPGDPWAPEAAFDGAPPPAPHEPWRSSA